MRRFTGILLLVLALSCSRKGSADILSVEDVISQPVQLAFGIGGDASATKGNPSVLTEMADIPAFRGIDQVYILPFAKRSANPQTEAIEAADESLYHMGALPGLSTNAQGKLWHLYPNTQVALPRMTASVLVYGASPVGAEGSDVVLRHKYGALTPVGFGPMSTLRKAADIGFEPVVIRADVPEEGQTLADILNGIVQGATYTVPYYYKLENEIVQTGESISRTWDESIDDARLLEWFQWFTNNGKLMPGSGPVVEYLIGALRRLLADYSYYDLLTPVTHSRDGKRYQAYSDAACQTPLMMSDVYDGLRDFLRERITALTATTQEQAAVMKWEDGNLQFVSESLHKYPQPYGLPDGSAVIRWDGVAFKPVGASLEGVAPMNAYCYPPRLWYYANTSISTLDAPADDLYASSDTWEQILEGYTSGRVVYASTESVALDRKLQYSCGMLMLTVRCSSATLDDGDGLPATTVTVGEKTFPLTGVIVGGQKALSFDFTPVTGSKEYFLYDNQVPDVYLVQAAGKTGLGQVRCFVSQTEEKKDIYLCLEFRNDSGKAFVGADGTVNPGSKFYLVGSLPHRDASVFQKDYTTEVNCVVPSLAEAHCAIPDLEMPRLSVGLEVDSNWIQSTSSSLILY